MALALGMTRVRVRVRVRVRGRGRVNTVINTFHGIQYSADVTGHGPVMRMMRMRMMIGQYSADVTGHGPHGK